MFASRSCISYKRASPDFGSRIFRSGREIWLRELAISLGLCCSRYTGTESAARHTTLPLDWKEQKDNETEPRRRHDGIAKWSRSQFTVCPGANVRPNTGRRRLEWLPASGPVFTTM